MAKHTLFPCFSALVLCSCPHYRLSGAQTPLNSPHQAGGDNFPTPSQNPLWGIYSPLYDEGGSRPF
ncbi:hypothetical protein ANACOL_00531 [Anaerotruncus colihominis DSM 17241]|uniref:Uncharacterized protein n=1 Tax=Anaerotruncus colihominis DSM 17241 TaxID=445972 RepID=B0P704_9FIRM|nr:hypothetical protein ANACOL_00531 [Anaerotruncus colihominis DSM 17241]